MKKYIIGLIFGIVLTLGGVVIAENLLASQINYKNNKSVSDALDDLYIEANKDILTKLNLSSDKVIYNESYGKRIPNRSTTLNVTAGSYFVFVSYHMSGGTSGTSTVVNNADKITLTYNNGTCTRLSGRKLSSYISPFSNANSTSNLASHEVLSVYACNFSQADILAISSNDAVTSSDYHESYIMAQAIKLD